MSNTGWNVLPLSKPKPREMKWSTAIVVALVVLALAWLIPPFGALVSLAALVWLGIGIAVFAWVLVRLIMLATRDGDAPIL